MTNKLRDDMPELPDRVRSCPVDRRGYPVPAFVALIDGEPDHRVVDPRYMLRAVRNHLCWICGQPLGVWKAFVLGPMCTVNCVSSEPGSHRDCAMFAVKACPFLSKPQMHRREAGLPENLMDPAGIMLLRNPKAMCVWITRECHVEMHSDGVLFRVGAPHEMTWWTEGRPATRAEVDATIKDGLPTLVDYAEQDGPDAVGQLWRQVALLDARLDQHLPS